MANMHPYIKRMGVAMTLKKLCTSKGTTGSSNDSFQLRPFQNGNSLKGKNLRPEGANSFRSE